MLYRSLLLVLFVDCLIRTIKTAIQSSEVYTYDGSLTTPPCSEAVAWFVVEEPLAVSVEQYKSFKEIMKFNSRYTQNDLNSPPNDNLIDEACGV
jgi:carbonic anhydrase